MRRSPGVGLWPAGRIGEIASTVAIRYGVRGANGVPGGLAPDTTQDP